MPPTARKETHAISNPYPKKGKETKGMHSYKTILLYFRANLNNIVII
jgi:hypothetical protein